MHIFVFTNTFVSTALASFGHPIGAMYNFHNFSRYLNYGNAPTIVWTRRENPYQKATLN